METGVGSFFQSIDILAPTVPLQKPVLSPYTSRIMGLEDCAKSKRVPGNAHQETGQGQVTAPVPLEPDTEPPSLLYPHRRCNFWQGKKNRQWHTDKGQGQAW